MNHTATETPVNRRAMKPGPQPFNRDVRGTLAEQLELAFRPAPANDGKGHAEVRRLARRVAAIEAALFSPEGE